MLDIYPKEFQEEVCKTILDEYNYERIEKSLELLPINMSNDKWQLHLDNKHELAKLKYECLLKVRYWKLEKLKNSIKTRKVPFFSTFLKYLLRFFNIIP